MDASIIETEQEIILEDPYLVSPDPTPLDGETLIIDDLSSIDNAPLNESNDASVPIINVNPSSGDVDNGDTLEGQENNTTVSEDNTIDSIYSLLLERLPENVENKGAESESESESESEFESESEITLSDINFALDKLYTLESEQYALIESNQVNHDKNSNMYSDYSVSVLIAVFGAVIASLFFRRL